MKRSVQWAAVVAVMAIAAGGCGKDSNSTRDTSKQSDVKKAVGQGNGMFGAIFTTNSSGEVVNGNIYLAKEDVYLNGGPKKAGAAGLPDGTYYYIVVDPGCKVELAGPSAPEPYNTSGKTITVEDGEFTELMQLAPFDDTPNPGGEYKVLVTLVSNYDTEAPGACFGFVHRWSKSDNFKVRAPKPPEEPDTFCISGKKCFDRNENGVCDSQEGPVQGVVLEISGERLESPVTTTTSSLGAWSFCGLLAGDYDVRELLPEINFWHQTWPLDNEPIHVTIVDQDIENLMFLNACHLESLEGPVPEEPCALTEEVIILE